MSVEQGEDVVIALLSALFLAGMFIPMLKSRWDKRKLPRARP